MMSDLNSRSTAKKNIYIGFFSQTIVLILGIIVPRIIIVNYGSDTNGLTSTITQIFTYMALLEAGISISARNAFYKPIQEDDKAEISNVASLAKRYYKNVSIVYLIAVVLVSLIFPLLFKTEISYFVVSFYILFEGLTQIVSFYFINTWSTFLQANGNVYIINVFTLITRVLCYGVKILLSVFAINIVFIQVGYFIVSLFQLLLYYLYMKKHYSWIKYNLKVENRKLPEKNANMISQIAWVVFSSTDMIVLSIFVSTAISSVYSVYNMVFVAINGLLNAVYASINYKLGIAYNSGDIRRYIILHDAFASFFVGSMTMLMSVCYFMIIPFVKLYTIGVTDVEYIYRFLPLFFCLIQILSWSRMITGNLIGISFRQKKAIKVNILEATINLALSIILVNIMGIEGVLLATVIALPIKVIYCSYVSDVIILKRSVKKTITILLSNYILFAVCVFISEHINLQVSNYLEFAVFGGGIFVALGLVFAFVNIFVNKDVLQMIKNFK